MSQYHPDEFLLMDYAAGNLSAAEALIQRCGFHSLDISGNN